MAAVESTSEHQDSSDSSILHVRRDWLFNISEFLTAGDIDRWTATSREWLASCLELKRALHVLTFDDLCSCKIPEAHDLRMLESLDLLHFSSRASYVKNCVAWLQRLALSRGAASQLTTLRLGPLLPKSLRSSLLKSCTQLTTVSLEGCQSIDDTLLSLLPPEIRFINLSGCWRITDAGLSVLVQTCPRVERALLERLNRITTAGIDALAAGWPSIHTLALCAESRLVSADCIARLVRRPRLTRLRVSGLNIHDDGWKLIFAAAAHRFQQPTVSDPRIGSTIIPTVFRHTNPLQQVFFTDAVGASQCAVMEFVSAIKSSFTRALDSVPAPTVSGLVCTGSSGMPLVSVNWSLLPGPTNLVRGSTMSETYFTWTLPGGYSFDSTLTNASEATVTAIELDARALVVCTESVE